MWCLCERDVYVMWCMPVCVCGGIVCAVSVRDVVYMCMCGVCMRYGIYVYVCICVYVWCICDVLYVCVYMCVCMFVMIYVCDVAWYLLCERCGIYGVWMCEMWYVCVRMCMHVHRVCSVVCDACIWFGVWV